MKPVALEGFLEKHRDVFRAIVTTKMEPFMTLVSSFQPLISFTKNINTVLWGLNNVVFSDSSLNLEFYNVF